MNRNNMNEQKQSATACGGGRVIRNDIVFICGLLVLLICAGLAIYFMRPEGDRVEVKVDGEVIGSYPLNQDAEIEIRTGNDNEQLNLLVIKDGKAYVQTATCRDGICANHSPINRVGQSIVCLPHKVSITVTSDQDAEAPDIVV